MRPIVLSLIFLFSHGALADPAVWTISGSPHLEGSFVYDPDTNTYTDFNVTSLQTGRDFSLTATGVDFVLLEPITEPSQPGGNATTVSVTVNAFEGFSPPNIDFTCTLLDLNFSRPLSGISTAVDITSSEEREFSDAACTADARIFAFTEGTVRTNQVAQAPLPGITIAALALLLLPLSRALPARKAR